MANILLFLRFKFGGHYEYIFAKRIDIFMLTHIRIQTTYVINVHTMWHLAQSEVGLTQKPSTVWIDVAVQSQAAVTV